MKDTHVEDLLIAHARGELDAGERAMVESHLADCDRCRASLQAFSRIMAELGRTAPPAPPIHWGAYRAELREKLGHRASRREAGWGRLIRPLPAAVAAGLVAVLLYAGLPGLPQRGRSNEEHAAFENAILASRLDMIAQLDLVQRLDLLEDFDVIGGLDRLPARSEG